MKKKWLHAFLLLVGVALALEGVHYARHLSRKNRHFVVSTSLQWKDVVPSAQKEVLPDRVKELLQQPFFFLGQGRQTIVFVGADGSCVLKLFKNVTKKKKRRRVRESLLGAYLAKTKLPHETGLLFCSISGYQGELPLVTLLTKKGKVEEVDLATVPFLLQRRAQPLKETLLRLRVQGRVAEAQQYVRSIFELLAACRAKQVVDRDGSLIRNGNIGLIDDQAVLLDTGKLCILADCEKQTLHDLNRMKPFVSWCKKAFPELLPTLAACRNGYQKTKNNLCKKPSLCENVPLHNVRSP